MAATFSFTAVHYIAPKLHHHLHLHRPSSFISYPYRTTALPIVVSASAASSPSNPKHLSALIKPLAITITAASVLLFANLSKPSFSIPISHAVESDTLPSDNHSDEEVERILEEHVDQNPDSLLDLNDLLEFKVKHQKFHDAASIVDQVEILTSNQGLEEDTQLRLLKLHFLIRAGELEKARNGFEEVLAKNPFYVDAYHGLLIIAEMSTDPEERRVETDNLLERIKINLERSKREKRKGDLDGFYLLMGHVKLREGKYDEAIEFFTKSAESEPRNFRPYLVIGKGGSIVHKVRQDTGARIRIDEPVPGCDDRVVVIIGDKDDVTMSEGGGNISPAQKALVRVFERILRADEEEKGEQQTVVCRLLTLTSQVGCVLGKGGLPPYQLLNPPCLPINPSHLPP